MARCKGQLAAQVTCSVQAPHTFCLKTGIQPVFLTAKAPSGFESPQNIAQNKKDTRWVSFLFGALQGTRTPDLLVRSQTLYPAELAAHDFRQLLYISTKGRVCQELFAKNSAKNPVLNCAVLVQINRKCAYSSFRSRLQGFLPYSKNRNRWDDNRPLCHCLLPRP